MYESEKGFLERVASAIPGIKGYREKESRRDTDKRLRDYLASELDRLRRALDGAKRERLAKGGLDGLDDLDRAGRKLQRAADALRFATYGYAGFFDQVKVRDEELERIYRYDEGLLGQVSGLETVVKAAGAFPAADGGEDAARALESAADTLLEAIEARKQLFNTPA